MTISLPDFAFATFCGKRWKIQILQSLLNFLVVAKSKQILGTKLVKFFDVWPIFHAL